MDKPLNRLPNGWMASIEVKDSFGAMPENFAYKAGELTTKLYAELGEPWPAPKSDFNTASAPSADPVEPGPGLNWKPQV